MMSTPSSTRRRWESARQRWRRLYAEQLHLHQVYLDRDELTGRETAAATRALRWRGDTLAGDVLPSSAG